MSDKQSKKGLKKYGKRYTPQFRKKVVKEIENGERLKMENKELKQTIIDERTGIEYNLVNDYYIPNIVLPKPRRTGNVGKYGRMRARYLKEHKKAEYSLMLIENELTSHLLNIDDICRERVDLLVK